MTDSSVPAAEAIERLLAIMRRLRAPHVGCPWDRAQTFQTLVPFTVEEVYEVASTIEQGTLSELPEELGDLLFQIVFYCQIGAERGEWDFSSVAGAISDKLVRRHPHVFAGDEVADVHSQSLAWEAHKQHEREQKAQHAGEESPGALDGVAAALPALSRAQKLQRRAARLGFDWDQLDGVFAKVHEELRELREQCALAARVGVEEEMGDVLFSVVNLARHLEVDAESSLRRACHKFERRFRAMETRLRVQGGDIVRATAAEMDHAWETVKCEEPAPKEAPTGEDREQ